MTEQKINAVSHNIITEKKNIYVYTDTNGIGKLKQKDFPFCIIIFIAIQRKSVVRVVREKKKTFQRECLQNILYHLPSSMMLTTLVKYLNKNKNTLTKKFCNKNFQVTWKFKMVMRIHFSNTHLWVAL